MRTRFGIVFSFFLGLFSAGAAQASDAVLGAIIGGGLGVVVGNQVGGRDGAVIGGAVGAVVGTAIAVDNDRRYSHTRYYYAPPPVRIHAPAPVYYRGARHVVHLPPPPPRNQWRNKRPAHNGRR
ncbi:MAG: hypothetical protein LBU46_01215 [Candidatus Accumulibacter sp.]|nr:hypothetical protein [Accumulibacter sp.]